MVVGLPPWAPQGWSGQEKVTMFPDDFFDFLFFLLLGEGMEEDECMAKGVVLQRVDEIREVKVGRYWF
jgi:hypothetical protein